MYSILSCIRKKFIIFLLSFLLFLFLFLLIRTVNSHIIALENNYINSHLQINIEELNRKLSLLYKNIYINFRSLKDHYTPDYNEFLLYIKKTYKTGYYYSLSLLNENGKPILTYPEGKRYTINSNMIYESFKALEVKRSNGYAVSSRFIKLKNGSLLLGIYFIINTENKKLYLEGLVRYTELLKSVIEDEEKKRFFVYEITVLDVKRHEVVSHILEKDKIRDRFIIQKSSFVRHPILIKGYVTKTFYMRKVVKKRKPVFITMMIISFFLSYFVFLLLNYRNKLKVEYNLNEFFTFINTLSIKNTSCEDNLKDISEFITDHFDVDIALLKIKENFIVNKYISPSFIVPEEDIPDAPLILDRNFDFRKWIDNDRVQKIIMFPIKREIKYGLLIFGFYRKLICKKEFLDLGQKIVYRLTYYYEIMNTRNRLIESERRYIEFIENAPIGINIIQKRDQDKEPVLVYQNPKMSEIIGYKSEEIFGKPHWYYVHPEYIPLVKERIVKRLKGEHVTEMYDIKIIRKSGEVRDVTIFPKKTTFKEKPAIITYMVDVTEKKAIEKDMINKQKLEIIGTFVGGFVHNLNNVLTGMIGYVNILKFKIFELPREKILEYLSILENISNQMKEISTNLLFVTRKREYKVENVDMILLIENLISLVKVSNKDKDIKFIKTFPQNKKVIVRGDVGYLNQVFLNIILNAIDAIDKKGNIIISFNEMGDRVKISIEDTGKGMSKDIINHIFEPFFTTKKKGTGLGLYTVYKVVKDMEGEVKVYSDEGKGTRFDIYLPKGTADIKEYRESLEEVKPVHEKKLILVVDDDSGTLKIAEEMLLSLGYEVIGVNNPEEVISIYKEHQDDISLVILDIIMPGINGIELYFKIKEINKDAKIILSSGYATDNLRKTLKEKGLNILLPKPYDLKTLSVIVKKFIDSQ